MKDHETFCKAQTASRLKKFIQPPPPSHPLPDKTSPHLTRSLKKIFLRRYIEIYRHLLSKYFKNAVLGRQEMVQCKYFFLTPNRNIFARKFVKSGRILAVLREHITFNVEWVEVRKMSEFFLSEIVVKCVIFFASFCWLWDFLIENLKLKNTLMMSIGTSEQI